MPDPGQRVGHTREEGGRGKERGEGEGRQGRGEARTLQDMHEHLNTVLQSAVKCGCIQRLEAKGGGRHSNARGYEPQDLLTQYEDLSTSQDAIKDHQGQVEGRGGEGVPKGGVPDIASKVGSGNDDLEDSKEDLIFDSQCPSNKDRLLRYNLELEQYISTATSTSKGGNTRAH